MLFTQVTQKKGGGQLETHDKCAMCMTMCVHYISIADAKWLHDWCQIGAVNIIIRYCSLVVVCALHLCMHVVVEGLVFNSLLL